MYASGYELALRDVMAAFNMQWPAQNQSEHHPEDDVPPFSTNMFQVIAVRPNEGNRTRSVITHHVLVDHAIERGNSGGSVFSPDRSATLWTDDGLGGVCHLHTQSRLTTL